MIQITGAWYLNNYPMSFAIELPDGGVKMARISPLAPIDPGSLRDYKSNHPKKQTPCLPVPKWLYATYGLDEAFERSDTVVTYRLTASEKNKLAQAARAGGTSETALIKGYIKGLPPISGTGD